MARLKSGISLCIPLCAVGPCEADGRFHRSALPLLSIMADVRLQDLRGLMGVGDLSHFPAGAVLFIYGLEDG